LGVDFIIPSPICSLIVFIFIHFVGIFFLIKRAKKKIVRFWWDSENSEIILLCEVAF
jgi:hypothetical protein